MQNYKKRITATARVPESSGISVCGYRGIAVSIPVEIFADNEKEAEEAAEVFATEHLGMSSCYIEDPYEDD